MTGQVDLSPAVWAFLRHALTGVVNERGHRRRRADSRRPRVAGKTGTAQSVANSDSSKGQDHAWFASFAPADDPAGRRGRRPRRARGQGRPGGRADRAPDLPGALPRQGRYGDARPRAPDAPIRPPASSERGLDPAGRRRIHHRALGCCRCGRSRPAGVRGALAWRQLSWVGVGLVAHARPGQRWTTGTSCGPRPPST